MVSRSRLNVQWHPMKRTSNRCFYRRARNRDVLLYENRIFMDCGISHIQHITRASMGLREREQGKGREKEGGLVPERSRDVPCLQTKL